MMTLAEKIEAIIETRLADFPKVEGVVVGRGKQDQTRSVLIAVQRVESFQTLFKIKLAIEPLSATVTLSPLTTPVDEGDLISAAQKEDDQMIIDFNTGDTRLLLNAIDKRLRLKNIHNISEGVLSLSDPEDEAERTVVLNRSALFGDTKESEEEQNAKLSHHVIGDRVVMRPQT